MDHLEVGVHRLKLGVAAFFTRARGRLAGASRYSFLAVLLTFALMLVWPLSRLSSQPASPPPRTPERLQSLKEIRQFREVFNAYASGADTPDRLKILHRFTAEGPAWTARIRYRGPIFEGDEYELLARVDNALAQYNSSPATSPSDLGAATTNLIALAQALDRFEASLAR